MEITAPVIAVVVAAYFFAGILDSVCGGGGLITVPALMITGVPVHMISGTNVCSISIGSATSAANFIRAGKVYWFTALIAIPTTLIGGILGAKANLIMPARYLQIIMTVIIPIMAVIMLAKKNFGEENRVEELSRRQQAMIALTIGLVLGWYNGFYGVGGGTMLIMAFALFTRLDLTTSIGNCRISAVISNFASAATYALNGAVIWPLVAVAMFASIAGGIVGAKLAIRNGAKLIRPMFLVILAVLLVKLVMTLVM